MASHQRSAEVLVELVRGFVVAKAVYAAAALGLADHMTPEPQPASAIAAACGCDSVAFTRLLRALSSSGVVVEGAEGEFGLTPVGELLRSEPPSLRDWVLLNGGLVYRVFGESLETFRSGEPASPRALGAPFFDYLGQHPTEAAIFDRAMRNMTAGAADLVLDSDVTGVRSAVDVGGGDGTLLIELLRRLPDAHGIVVDLESVVLRARERPEAAALQDRLRFLAGSFFEALPAGADLYLLAWVLHDWDDDAAVRILARCRQAMKPSSRLLILESVMPPGNEPHFSRYGDLVMLTLFNGRERTLQEFRGLLEAQDLQLHAVHRTPTPRCVLDVRLMQT